MPNYLFLRMLRLIVILVLSTALIILISVWNSTSKTVHKNIYGSLTFVKKSTYEQLEILSADRQQAFKLAMLNQTNINDLALLKSASNVDILAENDGERWKVANNDYQFTLLEINTFSLNQSLNYFFLNKNENFYFMVNYLDEESKKHILIGEKIDKDWMTALSNAAGTHMSLLYEDDVKPAFTTIKQDSIDAKALKNGIVGDSYFDLFNPSVLFGLQPLFTHEVLLDNVLGEAPKIYLSINAKRVSDNFIKLQGTIGLVAFFCVLASALLGYFTTRKITYPIETLTTYANKISKGDYTNPVIKNNYSKEISSLFEAFELMRKNIDEREKEIEYRAMHDTLTPLYNRDFVINWVSQQYSQKQAFQVVSFHILNFRQINDAFGHELGDASLVRIANRILGLGGLSARFSGAEFLWFPDKEFEQKELSDIKSKLEAAFEENSVSIKLKIAAAFMNCPEDINDENLFIKHLAILSDYSRRHFQSVNRFNLEMQQEYIHKISLITELSNEVDNGCKGFQLVYQPYKGLNGQDKKRAEALLRWNNEKLGSVPPADFIPVAEEIDVISKITRWVIQQVVKDLKYMQTHAIDIDISINISSKDLFCETFIPLLKQVALDTGFDNSKISLELTESVLVQDIDKAYEVMKEIRALGFKLALDDFGTGYSSLAYLSTLPVDTIKLDQTFIKDLSLSLDKRTLSKRIMQIASDYNLELVAEGVEDKDSLDYLSEQNCEWAQGFYMSKPLQLKNTIEYFSSANQVNKKT